MSVKKKTRTTLTSKWRKTKILLRQTELKPYIPDTRKFSRAALEAMLGKYEMVYVKPDVGTHGKGVVRVELLKSGELMYQVDTKSKWFTDFDSFYESLEQVIGERRYLVQKGIHVVKYKQRPFDIRVMVQTDAKGVWKTTGLIGRIANPRKIVTNYHNGGKLIDVKSLLESQLPPKKAEQTIKTLEQLGVKVGKQLHTKYPGFRQIGIDVGFDKTWRPRIFEVNTLPDPYVFNKLADKSMYREVMKYRRMHSV